MLRENSGDNCIGNIIVEIHFQVMNGYQENEEIAVVF